MYLCINGIGSVAGSLNLKCELIEDCYNYLMKIESGTCGIALIGVGMVGKTYAAAIRSLMPNVALTGVLASRIESSNAFLKEQASWVGGAVVYSTIDQLLDDDKVDIVVLATPPNARREYVQRLADVGKPILMEKPLERTLSAATELVTMCEVAKVPCGVVFQHRMRPSVQRLNQVLKSSQTGPLRVVEISVPWWREQSYYDEPGRGSYERDGGGVMINQAIHTMDLALQFTGPVESVSSLTATSGSHLMEAEDFVSAALKFSNGAVGNLIASTACFPGRSEAIHLHYDQVSVSLESSLLQLHWKNGESENIGEASQTGAGADPMAFSSDWHTSVIKDFIHAVQRGQNPTLSARSALPVHALIQALELSAKRLGELTPVPLVNQSP